MAEARMTAAERNAMACFWHEGLESPGWGSWLSDLTPEDRNFLAACLYEEFSNGLASLLLWAADHGVRESELFEMMHVLAKELEAKEIVEVEPPIEPVEIPWADAYEFRKRLHALNPDVQNHGIDIKEAIFKWAPYRGPSVEEVRLLRSGNPEPSVAFPVFAKLLLHQDSLWRLEAARALARLFGNDLPTIRGLDLTVVIAGLERGDIQERRESVEALWTLGVLPKKAVKALSSSLSDDDLEVRAWAFRSLHHLKGEDNASSLVTEALADTIRSLRTGDNETRITAARTLEEIGTPANSAATALKKTLQDDNCEVRFWAARALAAVHSYKVPSLEEETLDRLICGLEDRGSHIRSRSAEALEWLGSGAKQAVSALTKSLCDWDPNVRYAARNALDSIREG